MKGRMNARAVALAGLVGLSACAGLSTECPTGSVAAYQACDTRHQVEQTTWGTDFRLYDFDQSEVPPPYAASDDLAEPADELDELIVPEP